MGAMFLFPGTEMVEFLLRTRRLAQGPIIDTKLPRFFFQTRDAEKNLAMTEGRAGIDETHTGK